MITNNFPPFSVGEVKFLRSAGRREIGHGMLAERALKAMLPEKTEFPYTIRIVSDILESNAHHPWPLSAAELSPLWMLGCL